MEIEAKEEIEIAVQLLIELSMRHSRGDVIPWSEIEAIAGSRKPNAGSGPWIIEKWRRRLRTTHNIDTKVVTNCGVELLIHEKTLAVKPKLRYRKANSQFRKCRKELATVDPFALPSENQHRNLASSQAYAAEEQERIRDRLKRDEILSRPTPVNPIRPA